MLPFWMCKAAPEAEQLALLFSVLARGVLMHLRDRSMCPFQRKIRYSMEYWSSKTQCVEQRASHLVLDGAQVGQDDAKAHRDNEHQDAGDALAQAAQQHCVQCGHVGAVPRCVEVHKVKVPACARQHPKRQRVHPS